jgi:hypothetical protein
VKGNPGNQSIFQIARVRIALLHNALLPEADPHPESIFSLHKEQRRGREKMRFIEL